MSNCNSKMEVEISCAQALNLLMALEGLDQIPNFDIEEIKIYLSDEWWIAAWKGENVILDAEMFQFLEYIMS